MKTELAVGENIHRRGSEQQASKSVCHSSCWYEPPVDSISFPETEDLLLPDIKASDRDSM